MSKETEQPSSIRRGVLIRLIKINYYVMLDLISLPRQLVSRGHPEYIAPSFLDSGFRRNDKSLRDNGKFASPEGEGF
jgi:hypothetical protein